jgi:hypothetical protein
MQCEGSPGSPAERPAQMIEEGLSFPRRLHREEVVRDPNGVRYFVRVGRAGVDRFTPFNGWALPAIAYSWLRYVVGHRRTWTVQVRAGRFWHVSRPDLLCEEYRDRRSAAARADAIARGLASGQLNVKR